MLQAIRTPIILSFKNMVNFVELSAIYKSIVYFKPLFNFNLRIYELEDLKTGPFIKILIKHYALF